MEEDKIDEKGIPTNMRPKSKSAVKDSDQWENFLTQLEI